MKPITFQLENAHDVFDEMMPLFQKHYLEIAHFQDIPLEPAKAQYLALQDAGMLRVFTARDQGELIGYSVFFVRFNIHYSSSLQAVQDVLFIDPVRRGFGMRFLNWCDQNLQAEGVQAVYHHVKKEHNFGPLLERLGYKLVDLIFARRLD